MRWILVLLMMAGLVAPAGAEVFYKDNPVVALPPKPEKTREEIDCQNSKTKGCRGSGKPTRFMAFGDCRLISTNNGQGLFIPAHSKKEWNNFMGWADAHPDRVTVDSCDDPQWSDWSPCSATCGKGTHTRQCNRPLQNGKSGCSGEAAAQCEDYSSCECSPLEKRTVFCPGQDRDFNAPPPAVAYVDFDKCDGRTKCQARCPQDHPAVPQAAGCAP